MKMNWQIKWPNYLNLRLHPRQVQGYPEYALLWKLARKVSFLLHVALFQSQRDIDRFLILLRVGLFHIMSFLDFYPCTGTCYQSSARWVWSSLIFEFGDSIVIFGIIDDAVDETLLYRTGLVYFQSLSFVSVIPRKMFLCRERVILCS